MAEKQNYSADSVIGEPLLPATPTIGNRNAALTGSTPRIGATSIEVGMNVPPTTISFDKTDA